MKTNLYIIALALILSHSLQARRCSRLATVLGAITGASAAAAYNDCYPANPNYDFVYPGAPLYAYDYPTQMYSPVYSYINVRYSVYPSYYYSN